MRAHDSKPRLRCPWGKATRADLARSCRYPFDLVRLCSRRQRPDGGVSVVNRRPSSDPAVLKMKAATAPKHQSLTTPHGTPLWANQSLRNTSATTSTVTARPAAAVACFGAANGRRCPANTPPARKAAATRHAAMIQRWVGSSIIGWPCQLSSMAMVGTETTSVRRADMATSAQPNAPWCWLLLL